MQLMITRRKIGLHFLLAVCATFVIPSVEALPSLTKVTIYTACITAMACLWRLKTKKTQPTRVYPETDSVIDAAWFAIDELMVGQEEKGDRASKVTMNPDNPLELTIGYSKIEARGVTGILYSKMRPAIIPTLALFTLFNADLLKKVVESFYMMQHFANDPSFIKTAIAVAQKNAEKSFKIE